MSKFGCGAPYPQISHPRGPGSHRGLEPSTQLSKHSSFVTIITMARICFNSAGSQEQYFNDPHLVLVFSTGIFTFQLFFNSTFEALFKAKELAAAHGFPRGYSCIESSDGQSQKEPGFGDTTSTTAELETRPQGQKWDSDHPTLLHKLAENSGGPNQGQGNLLLCHEGASKMPP